MFEEKVEEYLRRREFHLQNNGILVGVSGGPDSLALLHFLWSRQEKWNIKVAAAHVDHMFRGKESEQEAMFVKEFCEKRNIPVEVRRINVPDYIKKTGLSSQVASRECRYSFFKEVLDKYEFQYLALGHHGDDQIETILMRLTRGSSGKARAGIPFSRTFGEATLFRPLLCLNREEIEQYCVRHSLVPRRDSSNDKDVYSRNRYRKVVLPFLRKENPQVHEHFQRLSEELESDEDYLIRLTTENMNKFLKKKTEEAVTIDIEAFLQMPMPLQRRGIQLILKYLYEKRPASLSAVHIDQIFSIMKNPHPSGTLDFPNGLKIVRSYNEIKFQYLMQTALTPFLFQLNEPGEVILPNGDVLSLEYVDHENITTNKNSLIFYAEENDLPLIIRTRKNGDRMSIKGMEGTKKIKDIFIDEKVPLFKRDRWPIVANHSGEIIWLPGLKKANFSSKKQTGFQKSILLTYKAKDF
jgi:tRNA(Ile)-lysidine synthase